MSRNVDFIQINFLGGTTIKDASTLACDIAVFSNSDVKFRFNGIDIEVKSGDNPYLIQKQYYDKLKRG